MNSDPILSLRGIRRSLGGSAVLSGLDLAVTHREILGIHGPSGGGKTTLARIIAGIDRGFEGERVLSACRPHLVFQDSLQSLNPRIKVRWALAEAMAQQGRLGQVLSHRRHDGDRMREALTEVGLSGDALGVRPGNLSGGQRQRLAIARALLSEANLLVLDEPVAALDPSVQARILNLLVRLHAGRDLTLVVISHDHGVLQYLCDRRLELQGGELCIPG